MNFEKKKNKFLQIIKFFLFFIHFLLYNITFVITYNQQVFFFIQNIKNI